MIYVYDGSFYGFLTCVHAHYYSGPADEIYKTGAFIGSIIDESQYIETDVEKAEKVERALKERFSTFGYMELYRTFLADDDKKDCYLLKYILAGFKTGRMIDRLYSQPEVINVRRLSKKVGFEAHRFIGLLRFVKKGVYLYGKIEPDHDILPLIADHFADRFNSEKIIIHDLKRNQVLIAYEGRWLIEDVHADIDFEMNPMDEKEALLQQLWKGYFEHIGIEGRKNKKLQQQFVPMKYRKHITEFKNR